MYIKGQIKMFFKWKVFLYPSSVPADGNTVQASCLHNRFVCFSAWPSLVSHTQSTLPLVQLVGTFLDVIEKRRAGLRVIFISSDLKKMIVLLSLLSLRPSLLQPQRWSSFKIPESLDLIHIKIWLCLSDSWTKIGLRGLWNRSPQWLNLWHCKCRGYCKPCMHGASSTAMRGKTWNTSQFVLEASFFLVQWISTSSEFQMRKFTCVNSLWIYLFRSN